MDSLFYSSHHKSSGHSHTGMMFNALVTIRVKHHSALFMSILLYTITSGGEYTGSSLRTSLLSTKLITKQNEARNAQHGDK